MSSWVERDSEAWQLRVRTFVSLLWELAIGAGHYCSSAARENRKKSRASIFPHNSRKVQEILLAPGKKGTSCTRNISGPCFPLGLSLRFSLPLSFDLPSLPSFSPFSFLSVLPRCRSGGGRGRGGGTAMSPFIAIGCDREMDDRIDKIQLPGQHGIIPFLHGSKFTPSFSI